MLTATGVRKGYDAGGGHIEVLTGVDLAVGPGEFVCIYGASGSGKSTLLHLLAGLDSLDAGTVRIGELEVSSASEAARARMRLEHVGVVFQRDNLLLELSAEENVALPLLALGRSRAEAGDLARTALGRVGMAAHSDRLPEQLSGGERQRVGIARGLVGDRTLLLADEPTGSLDAANSQALFELLRDLAHGSGAAVVVATHDPLAVPMADRVLTMVDGQLDGV